ncbi:MAG: 2-C-methyl-D-erythritol 2,4-cyclodiphosphate synthase [Bacteroidales bacterium]|nr:2-C-methyl-D-erythritol 2,4-cyclodiphosphate synthase [Bacteroidales bacterium]
MMRIGNGYDVHRLAKGYRLVLGGVEIPHEKGCVAHSDGDVVLHALCDALLGALSLGDIGQHFPDTSDEYLGIDSKILLERTYSMVKEEGYSLVNADITLLLQKPKIAPYIAQMKDSIASVLGVPANSISVKATTTERLGYIGREEGVSCYATILLSKS